LWLWPMRRMRGVRFMLLMCLSAKRSFMDRILGVFCLLLWGEVGFVDDVLMKYRWAFQMLFAITNQMLGYGLAGVCRRWLVWPAAMIWPANLVNCALMYTLHDHSSSDPAKTNGWSISRYRYFLYVMIGAFCWYFFPGWIFQGLSYFTFACWIAPNNPVVNQLFGGVTGLGLIPITFDWTIISGFIGSPLIP